ncbi:protein of unknown function [Magnetospira sp. QH-2]|nr:protein of unknown function [Magnetospira sp. QH-2]
MSTDYWESLLWVLSLATGRLFFFAKKIPIGTSLLGQMMLAGILATSKVNRMDGSAVYMLMKSPTETQAI